MGTVLAAVLAAWQAPAVVATDLRIATGGVALAATLTLPGGPGRHPAVILMHGSGPSTRAALRQFAEPFHSLGVATLVYDKRGSGESTGSWISASLDDHVADAQAAFAVLRRHPRIDAARIGVWGVSQAGWFIPVLAARTPGLAFAMVLTGGGSTPRDVELFGHRAALDRVKATAAERAEAEALLDAYFAWLGTGVNRSGVAARLAEAKAAPWFGVIGLDRVMPSDDNRPNWAWVARFDPMPFIGQMRLPTLVVLGAEDPLVDSAQAAGRWRAGLARAGNERATVKVIDGMGHAATAGGAHSPPGAHGPAAPMPAYLAEVAAFIAAVRSPTPIRQ
jgi:hypothetical protein